MAGKSTEQARTLIERRLEGHLSDREWQRLNEERLVAAGTMNREQVDALVTLIRDRRATWGPPPEQPKSHRPTLRLLEGEVAVPEEDTRLDALAQILVYEARKDRALQEFRAQRLHGELFAQDQLVKWMQEKSASEVSGTGDYFLEVPMTITVANDIVTRANSATLKGNATEVFDVPVNQTLQLTAADLAKAQSLMIPFYDPTDGSVYKVQRERQWPDSSPSFMNELLHLSTRLAADYGWSVPETVTFVVTDTYQPRIIPARYKIEADRIGIPALARIVLTLDPAVAPQSVAEVYRQARQSALPGGRVRDLSEKHLLLALFAAEQVPETSVDERMARWNEAHPNMPYQKRSYFERDCRLALARLRQEHEK